MAVTRGKSGEEIAARLPEKRGGEQSAHGPWLATKLIVLALKREDERQISGSRAAAFAVLAKVGFGPVVTFR